MSRDDGFKNADVDTTMLDDPKLRRLHRLCGDEALAARAIVAYLATVLASWQTGERVDVADAAPLWLTDVDDIAGKLEAAQLVDSERRIPEHAWLRWYGPASQRRSDRQFEGLVGGLMRSMGLSKLEAMGEARRRMAVDTGTPLGQVPVQVDLGATYPDPAGPGPRDEEKNERNGHGRGLRPPFQTPRCSRCQRPIVGDPVTNDSGSWHPACRDAIVREVATAGLPS